MNRHAVFKAGVLLVLAASAAVPGFADSGSASATLALIVPVQNQSALMEAQKHGFALIPDRALHPAVANAPRKAFPAQGSQVTPAPGLNRKVWVHL